MLHFIIECAMLDAERNDRMLKFVGKPKPKDLCPCGSGKQFRKCCNKKLLRRVQVEIEIDPPQKIDLIKINEKDGTIKIFSEGKTIIPKFARSTVGYKGTSKFRYVSDLIIPTTSMTIDPSNSYLAFDELYAVDTNTKLILNVNYAISVAFKAGITLSNNYLGYEVKMTQVIAKDFTSDMNHEKIGWVLLITHLMETKVINDKKLIGVVVDHDRENISKYNRKDIPIIGDLFLPNGVRLIYASSDRKGSIYNALIKNCDERSNELFEIHATNIKKCISETGSDTKCI